MAAAAAAHGRFDRIRQLDRVSGQQIKGQQDNGINRQASGSRPHAMEYRHDMIIPKQSLKNASNGRALGEPGFDEMAAMTATQRSGLIIPGNKAAIPRNTGFCSRR